MFASLPQDTEGSEKEDPAEEGAVPEVINLDEQDEEAHAKNRQGEKDEGRPDHQRG